MFCHHDDRITYTEDCAKSDIPLGIFGVACSPLIDGRGSHCAGLRNCAQDESADFILICNVGARGVEISAKAGTLGTP